jgi:hypothetical protein
MNRNRLQHLAGILTEVGDKLRAPYPDVQRTEDGRNTRWDWETPEGVLYRATAVKGPNRAGGITYNIIFGIRKSNANPYDVSYVATSRDTATGDVYRVMSTMIDLIKKEIAIDTRAGRQVQEIVLEPTKSPSTPGGQDMRRANIYTDYILNNMPKGSSVKTDSGGYRIAVQLPNP